MAPAPVWVATESEANAAIAEISKHDVAGFDTEFWGVDVGKESCVGRSILDVFSCAIKTTEFQPLGYFKPRSWVFAPELITTASVRGYLEEARYRKVIHNRTVDEHTLFNAGIRLRGGQCTLNMARFVYPERANLPRGNYDLDSICRWRFGIGKVEEFDDLFGYDEYIPFQTQAEKKFCLACGAVDVQSGFGCRKKKAPHDNRVVRTTEVTRSRKVRKHVHLPEVRSGHKLWGRYLRYAAVDAELALILYQLMVADAVRERAYPWGEL